MGRYQPKLNTQSQQGTSENVFLNQQQFSPEDWPTNFPKCVIGIDRDGVINEWKNVIKKYEDLSWIPGSMEAIRKLRLSGYKIVIFSDQPNISKGLLTQQDVGNIMNYYMQIFGKNGIFSIDGFYYNSSDSPQDPYAKPNIGMLNRSQSELKVNFKEGYYVGDTIEDIKMAIKIGAVPVLVRTGKGSMTEEKYLKSFDPKYKDVQIFDNLLEFSKSI